MEEMSTRFAGTVSADLDAVYAIPEGRAERYQGTA
jgi:hypothetical protein